MKSYETTIPGAKKKSRTTWEPKVAFNKSFLCFVLQEWNFSHVISMKRRFQWHIAILNRLWHNVPRKESCMAPWSQQSQGLGPGYGQAIDFRDLPFLGLLDLQMILQTLRKNFWSTLRLWHTTLKTCLSQGKPSHCSKTGVAFPSNLSIW